MNTNQSFSKTRSESFADGLTLGVDERGSGRAVLVLHGARGPHSVAGFAAALAARAHVFTPTHPGFEGEPRPEWFTGVDDLALAYLDLLERLDLRDVIVVGFSFGGWIAAELAVRDTTRLGGLILVDAAGIEVEGYQMNTPRPPVAPNPQAEAPNPSPLAVYARDGFIDPKLRRRLARVRIPALVVWGENDSVIAPDYGRAYAQALPDARFTLISDAGHFPQLDQPEQLLNRVWAFVDSIAVSDDTQRGDA